MLGMQMEERNKHTGINTHSYAYSSTEKLTCTLVHRYIQSHTHTHTTVWHTVRHPHISVVTTMRGQTHTLSYHEFPQLNKNTFKRHHVSPVGSALCLNISITSSLPHTHTHTHVLVPMGALYVTSLLPRGGIMPFCTHAALSNPVRHVAAEVSF